MKTPPELDKLVDVVLAYRPKPKTKAQKKRARKKAKRAYDKRIAEDHQNENPQPPAGGKPE